MTVGCYAEDNVQQSSDQFNEVARFLAALTSIPVFLTSAVRVFKKSVDGFYFRPTVQPLRGHSAFIVLCGGNEVALQQTFQPLEGSGCLSVLFRGGLCRSHQFFFWPDTKQYQLIRKWTTFFFVYVEAYVKMFAMDQFNNIPQRTSTCV